MTHNPHQKKIFGAAALLLAGALAAGTALAQHAPGHFARGIRAAMATLDLSDAQKDDIRAIFASHKGEGTAFHAQIKADRDALKAAASAAKPASDEAALPVEASATSASDGVKAARQRTPNSVPMMRNHTHLLR